MDALSFQTIYHQHQHHLDCYKNFTGKTPRKNLQEMTEPLRPHPESKITRSFSKLDKTN